MNALWGKGWQIRVKSETLPDAAMLVFSILQQNVQGEKKGRKTK